MTRVLVVDDEPQILRALYINLTARHYDIVTATNAKQALDAASHAHPDLIVIDLGLPDMDGVDVIHALRGWSKVPIVILSGRAQNEMKIRALEAGADDYVTKPFNVDELIARVRAVARRSAPADEAPTVASGEVVVDLEAHRVTRTSAGGSEDVRLTPTEWQLLQSSSATQANSSPSVSCCAPYAARSTTMPATCSVSTWPSSAKSSNRIRPGRSTCSPTPAWGTAFSRSRPSRLTRRP